MTQCSTSDLQRILGQGKFNAMIKSKWYTSYSGYEKAYKHGVTRSGFHTVEVYPYFSEIHTNANGKVRPVDMLKFTFTLSTSQLMSVDKYHRSKEPDENEKRLGPTAGWRHAIKVK